MSKSNLKFSKLLITWYLEHKRDLPWRTTKDPYYIWLSEIILQQTRVAQGLPYYNNFISTFPSIEILASASEEKVLKLWQGLGYYSRARNLHFTAKYIVEQLQSKFPKTYKDLLQLKGVGDYTASAIASICFQEPTAVVDGNVYRVLSRVFGIDTPINTTKGVKEFKELAQILIDPAQPGIFNQAVMEFGARHCKPQKPFCDTCVFNNKCVAFQKKNIAELPVKVKKNKIKKEYFNYIVPLTKDHYTLLQQRIQKGIWQQLYEFPLIKTPKEIDINSLLKLRDYQILATKWSFSSLVVYNEQPIIHKLSHRHLHTKFWIVKSDNLKSEKVAIPELEKYPVPVLIEKFINSFFKKEE